MAPADFETQVNGDSKSTSGSGWLVCWACRAGTRDFCSALAALVGPVKIFFSSPYTILIFFPHQTARWAGSRAGSPVF